MSRQRKRRSGRPARQPVSEVLADEADPFWIYVDGRRMFVAGRTSGGVPFGVFEDEMDADMNILDGDERDPPYDFF